MSGTPLPGEPLSLAGYMALRGPDPDERIAYGPAPSQYIEVFVPGGSGPHPVALLVHGGCWWRQYEGIGQLRAMAAGLVARGIAVWNVEYRRIDEPGGGFPGTWLDAAAAADALAGHAGRLRLDTDRLVAVGHSAGGTLVQWLAGRARIAPASPLYARAPLRLGEVVALSSIADLRAWTDLCGFEVTRLTGGPADGRPDAFADTNPADLVPNGSRTVLVNGGAEYQVPPAAAARFAALARAAGERIETVTLPGAGHFDAVAPGSPHWPTVLALIERAVGVR